MTQPLGFKTNRAVGRSRHSRTKPRQKGSLRTLPLLLAAGINLRLSVSRQSDSRGVFGRRRPETSEYDTTGGHDGR